MPACLNKELKMHLHDMSASFSSTPVYMTIAGIGEKAGTGKGEKDHGREEEEEDERRRNSG